MRRELLELVLAVVVVDVLFIAGFYLLFRLAHASAPMKVGYTAAWTAVTLVIVLRALVGIRTVRSRDADHGSVPRG